MAEVLNKLSLAIMIASIVIVALVFAAAIVPESVVGETTKTRLVTFLALCLVGLVVCALPLLAWRIARQPRVRPYDDAAAKKRIAEAAEREFGVRLPPE